jgi:hypothetical protein
VHVGEDGVEACGGDATACERVLRIVELGLREAVGENERLAYAVAALGGG